MHSSMMFRDWLRLALAAGVVAIVIWPSPVPAQQAADSLERDYAAELPRIDPLSPAQAMEQFEVEPGFHVELVASEPLVSDPVAVAFDEYGRIFVAEMRGYSEDRDQNLGLIRRLVDTDADGRFDESTVFAKELAWPTAVACWDGGIFVAAAPHIYYCKDNDDDGRADQQEIVFTGFGRSNVQGLLNSFIWGLDNRLYGATSSCGGEVRKHGDMHSEPLSLRRRDFVIEPRSMSIAAASGGGQHGQSFDAFGRRFVCANSNHLQMIMFEDRYIARNPLLATPNANLDIAADGPQAPVFRASPVEPWRIVRTRLRVQGIVGGPVEGGGKPAGYFTGATGVTIYKGDAFGPKYRGSVFVADCGSNLLHRKVLVEDGVGFIGERATADREFLASRDIWFRPVQMANAPDGALYVLDMSREVIEHPHSIPPIIKRHVDLTSGRTQGRIYRIVPDDFTQRDAVSLGDLSSLELTRLLGHANGWHRETAARLIYERQDHVCVPLLDELAESFERPEGRIRAMYALDGLNALQEKVIHRRLDDKDARVREHAVRLAESRARGSPELRKALYGLANDVDTRVRYQLAFSLGEFRGVGREEALTSILKRDGSDRWVRLAVQSSLADGAGKVFALLADDVSFRQSEAGRNVLVALAQQLGAGNRPAEIAHLLKVLPVVMEEDETLARNILQAATSAAGAGRASLQEQLALVTKGKSKALLEDLVRQAVQTAFDESAPEAARLEAVRSLAIGKLADIGEELAGLLDARYSQELQLGALRTLAAFDDDGVSTLIIARLETLSPRVRGEALETLCSRRHWVASLLNAVAEDRVAATLISPASRQFLLSHPSEEVRSLASEVFAGHAIAERSGVIESYRPALELAGDVERGREAFRKVCASCHRLEGYGHQIGKDLKGIRNRGAETILVNVLDPNREVDPAYVNYIAVTDDGRSITGFIAGETSASVTLRRAENVTDVLLRRDIDQLRSTGTSIMPEGLEKEISLQSMADLIAYLLSQE